MGEGILPTEEVVKWQDGESLDLGPLLSASSGSQGISAADIADILTFKSPVRVSCTQPGYL